MFKKDRDLSERSNSLLKNKEIRDLKANIVKQFIDVDDAILNELFHKKSSVSQTKLASRTIIYSVDNIPLIFDKEGRSNLYPTIFFLWKFPRALKTFIVHPPVSQFILNGAALMLPGLASHAGLDQIDNGDKVSIRIYGNPYPFAVGDALQGYEMMKAQNFRGKGVEVLHYYSDMLCHIGETKNIPVMNGFRKNHIVALDTSEYVEIGEQKECETYDNNMMENEIIQDTTDTLNEVSNENNNKDKEYHHKETLVENTEEGHDDTALKSVMAEEDTEPISTEEMNDIFIEAIARAFRYVIKDKHLPILVNLAWPTILKCAPKQNGVTADIKKTSFKKVSVFVSFCQNHGFLSFVEENDAISIQSINRSHEWFHRIHIENLEEFKQSFYAADDPSYDITVKTTDVLLSNILHNTTINDTNRSENPSVVTSGNGKYQIIDVYKTPKNQFYDLFHGYHGEYGDRYRLNEVKQVLMNYIKAHNLENQNNRAFVDISIDHTSLFKIASKLSSVHMKGKEISINDSKKTNSSSLRNESSAEIDDPTSYADSDEELSSYREQQHHQQQPILDRGQTVIGGVLTSPIKSSICISNDVDFPSLPSSNQTDKSVSRSVESGQKMKPVSLPSKSTITAKASSSQKNPKAGVQPMMKSPPMGSSLESPPPAVRPDDNENTPNERLASTITLSKEELLKSIIGKLTPYHVIVSPVGEVTVHSGKPPTITITLEQRAGNKMVTRVVGLEDFGIALNSFSKDCQKKFACSVSVGTTSNTSKDKEVIIQGNFSSQLENLLIQHTGIPRSAIVIVQMGKKSKKSK